MLAHHMCKRYNPPVIVSFDDKATEDVYNGVDSKEARSIPRTIWGAAVRKLDMLDAAADLMDLKAPPGNRLEKLKGDRTGQWSIRINDQFRVVFAWNQGKAERVTIEDYH